MEKEYKIGQWWYILGTGHTIDNKSFPKGEVFRAVNYKEQDTNPQYYLYNDKSSNHNVTGTYTNTCDCRLAEPHEIPEEYREKNNSIEMYSIWN